MPRSLAKVAEVPAKKCFFVKLNISKCLPFCNAPLLVEQIGLEFWPRWFKWHLRVVLSDGYIVYSIFGNLQHRKLAKNG